MNGGISQLAPNTKSVPIPHPKAALHSYRGPLRSFQSLCGTPVKAVTWSPQEMRVGFVRPPGFPFWFTPNAMLLLPQVLISGLSEGLFLEAASNSAWRACPGLSGKAGQQRSPRSEHSVSP